MPNHVPRYLHELVRVILLVLNKTLFETYTKISPLPELYKNVTKKTLRNSAQERYHTQLGFDQADLDSLFVKMFLSWLA